jgi:hypothetical protein
MGVNAQSWFLTRGSGGRSKELVAQHSSAGRISEVFCAKPIDGLPWASVEKDIEMPTMIANPNNDINQGLFMPLLSPGNLSFASLPGFSVSAAGQLEDRAILRCVANLV